MEVLEAKGVYFDCYETERNGYWTEICNDCLKAHPELQEYAHDSGAGIGSCGVFGCFEVGDETDEGNSYLDFSKEDARIIDVDSDALEEYVTKKLNFKQCDGKTAVVSFEQTNYTIPLVKDEGSYEKQAAQYIVEKVLRKNAISILRAISANDLQTEEEKMITVENCINHYKKPFDVYDTEYDVCITVTPPLEQEKEEPYDTFVRLLCSKVQICEQREYPILIADWTGFIKRNVDALEAFSKKHWVYAYTRKSASEFYTGMITGLGMYVSGYGDEEIYKEP